MGQIGPGGNPGRIHQRTSDEHVHELQRNGVHHDGAEDFIHFQAGFQNAWDKAPGCSAEKTQDQSAGNQQPARPGMKGQREPGGDYCPECDLALATYIDHIGPEGDANAQTDQQERGGLDQGLGNSRKAAPGAADHG